MDSSYLNSANSTKRILVVDDIIDNSFLLQVLLQEEGYQVEVANNGFAALAKVEEAPPDLILLDVMMPEMSGYDVTRHIRRNQALPFIPILLVTGYDQPKVDDALACGADGLIGKPIDFVELVEQIRLFLSDETNPYRSMDKGNLHRAIAQSPMSQSPIHERHHSIA